jgi:malate permease and related proteins
VSALLSVVIPAAIVVLAGALAGRKLELELGTLTRLTLYILSPALIIDSMLNTDLPAREGARIALAFALTTVLLYLLVAAICRAGRLARPAQTSLMASTLFPNTGNLGLSLTLLALGPDGLQRAIVIYLGSAVLVFGFGPALVSGHGLKRGIATTLRLPLMWALAGGIGLRVAGINLPLGVGDGIHLLAQAAVPVLLLTLGMQISRTRFAPAPPDLFVATLRLAIGPLAAYIAGRLVGLDQLGLQVLVLQCATPTAVNALLVAAEFGGDTGRAARAVVLTTILSFASLPIVMWLMGI